MAKPTSKNSSAKQMHMTIDGHQVTISFAQEYHINYIYLSRKFKELTGETFTNYLMQIRMDKARQLIEQDGFSEKAAAPLVGYSNPYYFISSYRKYFGLEEQNEN